MSVYVRKVRVDREFVEVKVTVAMEVTGYRMSDSYMRYFKYNLDLTHDELATLADELTAIKEGLKVIDT